MSEPLAQALRISGASLIMLTSIESRTTVWSAGRGRVGAEVSALGAAITEAAAEMVRLTSAGVELDDLLVTSPANFHVLRVVGGQVAHLVLDRGTANLAMARREFRLLAESRVPTLPAAGPVAAVQPVSVVQPVAASEPSEAVETAEAVETGEPVAPAEVEWVAEEEAPAAVVLPEQRQPVFEAALEGEVLPASHLDLVPTDPDLPRLPQRRADSPWADDPADYEASVPELPDWLRAAAGGPFLDDLQTLDRVVGGLRRL